MLAISRLISAILWAVRNFLRGLCFLLMWATVLSAQQPNIAPPVTSAAPNQPPPAFTIILDPGHGGTDPGALGPNGGAEKDITLQIAKGLRTELIKSGYRVVLTREDDSNPSYDDRAGTANSYRDAIFVSIHVASTGVANTVRTYWYPATPAPVSATAPTPNNGAPIPQAALPQILQGTPTNASGLIWWAQAQQPYVGASQRIAAAMQMDLAAKFSGSASDALPVAIRTLRSVALPAIAVEFSNVSALDAAHQQAIPTPLAAAISHAVQTYRASANNPEAH